MLNKNQEKIIKEEFNKYMNNIKIPENLEGIIMEDMNKIENDEMNENQNSEKKFSATKAIGIAAAVVIVVGVVGVTGLKRGWFNNNNKQSTIAESQSESGKGTKVVGGDKTKSLYDIEEYTDNLTDAANGKLAFLKLLENDGLQTEKHGDYYTYIDQFENKYNIKEITNVTSGKGTMGVDNWAALFKVTVIYIDNTKRTNTMDLAIILLPNHEIQNRGTYDNFTGTTSYVKGFTNLYDYDNEEVSEERIRELADMYLKISNAGSLKASLDVLGFKNVRGEMISNDGYGTEKLNVKYNDYKKKMLEYFTNDHLDKFDTDNGYITAPALGGDGGADTKIININKVSSNKYKIDYNAKVRGDGGNSFKGSITITVKFEDGKFVISEVINDNSSVEESTSDSNTNEFSPFGDLVSRKYMGEKALTDTNTTNPSFSNNIFTIEFTSDKNLKMTVETQYKVRDKVTINVDEINITNEDIAAGTTYISFDFNGTSNTGNKFTGNGTISYSNVADNTQIGLDIKFNEDVYNGVNISTNGFIRLGQYSVISND